MIEKIFNFGFLILFFYFILNRFKNEFKTEIGLENIERKYSNAVINNSVPEGIPFILLVLFSQYIQLTLNRVIIDYRK